MNYYKEYIKDLNPIEGEWDIQEKIIFIDRRGYQCFNFDKAYDGYVIRTGEGYCNLYDKDGKSINHIWFTPIGETNVYRFVRQRLYGKLPCDVYVQVNLDSKVKMTIRCESSQESIDEINEEVFSGLPYWKKISKIIISMDWVKSYPTASMYKEAARESY